jgi:drug/metabolite transporter (DMT)-like permease
MGPLLALLSAALFGISPVFAKQLVGEISPLLLAGLLYLGSGLALTGRMAVAGERPIFQLLALKRASVLKLLGAVAAGGILAPLFLVYALKFATAFDVSLLLNLEPVATTLIAYLIFHEHVSGTVWFGKLLLLAGAAVLVFATGTATSISYGGLFVLAACVFWGIDNNLTRDVEDLSPTVLAGVKGLVAGSFNSILAVILSLATIGPRPLAASLLLGALSYGVSLVLFVKALRALGAARTSTYFATGPFWGTLLSVLFLGENPSGPHWVAAWLMGLGILTLYRENHVHEHVHEEMTHSHRHRHDEHHQHSHEGTEGPEPHVHAHTHRRLVHSHWHLPDIHHRHTH